MYYAPFFSTYQYQYPNSIYFYEPINNMGHWHNHAVANQLFYHQPIESDYRELNDYGKQPYVVNINEATKQNNTYRTAIWTGEHLQVTLMSLKIGEDIGLEIHPNVDQFLRIEQGQGVVQMGKTKNNLNYVQNVYDDFAIMIPAGTWHNVTNTGNTPLKLYSIYAPKQHPFGTVHETKADALATERSFHSNSP
ncbi:cupin domain-containing protein [Bacillus sp. 1P06AnD]|uniref:cupin domain-containing protein n=1 Tax=Bacillus sp. 1P06AnD TaxID=3132208 RepID=UPI0039A3CAC3